MALEFISDAEGELLMKLDIEGLGELLTSLVLALKTGEPQLVPVVRNSANAIGEVTVVFRRPRKPRKAAPEPPPPEGVTNLIKG